VSTRFLQAVSAVRPRRCSSLLVIRTSIIQNSVLATTIYWNSKYKFSFGFPLRFSKITSNITCWFWVNLANLRANTYGMTYRWTMMGRRLNYIVRHWILLWNVLLPKQVWSKLSRFLVLLYFESLARLYSCRISGCSCSRRWNWTPWGCRHFPCHPRTDGSRSLKIVA
jgi:hypothetical protein